MKYKNSDLELPPLGEIIVVSSDERKIIGEFYLDSDRKRKFRDRCALQDASLFVNCIEGSYKWASLPKFKSAKKELPPVGIDVLFACASFDQNVLNYFNVQHFIKGQKREYARDNTNAKEILIDAWIELENFNEDK